jgi:signal transduction histidine kinase
MKRASWVCCASSVVVLLGGCARDGEALQHVTQAEIAVQPFGNAAMPPISPQVPSGLSWQAVTLPHIAKPEAPSELGQRFMARVWVRFTPAPTGTSDGQPSAVTYAAFLASGSQAVLYADGHMTGATDHTVSNGFNAPVLLELPPSASAPGSAPVPVTLSLDCYVGLLGCGVPSLYFGPLPEAARHFELARLVRIDAPRIGSVAIVIVGFFSLVFWIRRRQETVYLLFAVASVLWGLRTLHYHLPYYPEPQLWFWWATVASFGWLSVTVYLFAFRLHGERHPRVEWALIAAAAIATISGLPPLSYDEWVYERIAYGMHALLSLAVTVLLTIAAFRLRTREHTAMAIALWINFAAGTHDWLLQGWQLNLERAFLLPYGALPLFAAFLYAMGRRYRAAISDMETLNATLEQRLAERQRELAESYAKLRDYEVLNAQVEERQRLMRDMHDGLGSSLMSSLAICERGDVDPAFIVKTLREAVDDLKLTIDSMEPIEQDLVTLLATLRYRLMPRLERSGLKVDWEMSEVPELEWLDASSSLQILRILQESITNVLKHARATRVRIATAVDSDVTVTIADDGVGFDPARAEAAGGGRGLRNLRHRAAKLGGDVEIQSNGEGTTVMLRLPLVRVSS